ncbi:MAG TPA: TetR/AcrR family transcriptional regulator [Spirochaetota bacterium]|nr:TetR/AcrR family transcriptional regulator [Spirochaetota bacterium]
MTQSKYKARSPVQQRGIESREKIIEAARALFSEKGYHSANALEIAARAGLATGTFYSYFNNKKEVLIEIIRTFYKETVEDVFAVSLLEINDARPSIIGKTEGRKLVHYMIETLFTAHSLNPELHREILAMILLDPEIAEINRQEEGKVIAYLSALLGRYKDLIRVNDSEAAAHLVYRAADEVIHRVRFFDAQIDGTRLLSELEEMMCRYLLREDE